MATQYWIRRRGLRRHRKDLPAGAGPPAAAAGRARGVAASGGGNASQQEQQPTAAGGNASQQQPPRCQVEGCGVDLIGVKGYYCRHKVCAECAKAPPVVVAGIELRVAMGEDEDDAPRAIAVHPAGDEFICATAKGCRFRVLAEVDCGV